MALKLVGLDGEETTLKNVLADDKNYPAGKFVVVEKDGTRYACLFSSNIMHFRVAGLMCGVLDGTFVAAGKRCSDCVYYDSSSCEEKYGSDHPGNPAEAKKLLEELEALLLSE